MVTFLCLFEEAFVTSNKYGLGADAIEAVFNEHRIVGACRGVRGWPC